MRISLFYIDAFTSEVFKGNTAAVCLLGSWLPDDVLQSIAAEQNLPETAFVVKDNKDIFQLKWFTPKMEIDLCGHATLAAAHVLFNIYNFSQKSIQFRTKSGFLPVKQSEDGIITLDFPVFQPDSITPPALLAEGLGTKYFSEVYKTRDLMVVFNSEDDIIKLSPDFTKLKELDCLGVIVTAPGKGSDYVLRFFAPSAGVDEDPVTGSAQSSLVPYWSKKFKKDKLYARQLSERGGDLWCQQNGDRVLISGHAITYMQGTINISIKPQSTLIPFNY
jgi:PhzF family phenazine biosynthesis protein